MRSDRIHFAVERPAREVKTTCPIPAKHIAIFGERDVLKEARVFPNCAIGSIESRNSLLAETLFERVTACVFLIRASVVFSENYAGGGFVGKYGQNYFGTANPNLTKIILKSGIFEYAIAIDIKNIDACIGTSPRLESAGKSHVEKRPV